MNKFMHTLVLVVFAGACWFLSLILKLPNMILPMTARLHSATGEQASLPAFTRACMVIGPVVLGIFATAALAYCIYIWLRKAHRPGSVIGFLATSLSALMLVLLPTVVAIYIPLVDFLNRSTVALSK